MQKLSWLSPLCFLSLACPRLVTPAGPPVASVTMITTPTPRPSCPAAPPLSPEALRVYPGDTLLVEVENFSGEPAKVELGGVQMVFTSDGNGTRLQVDLPTQPHRLPAPDREVELTVDGHAAPARVAVLSPCILSITAPARTSCDGTDAGTILVQSGDAITLHGQGWQTSPAPTVFINGRALEPSSLGAEVLEVQLGELQEFPVGQPLAVSVESVFRSPASPQPLELTGPCIQLLTSAGAVPCQGNDAPDAGVPSLLVYPGDTVDLQGRGWRVDGGVRVQLEQAHGPMIQVEPVSVTENTISWQVPSGPGLPRAVPLSVRALESHLGASAGTAMMILPPCVERVALLPGRGTEPLDADGGVAFRGFAGDNLEVTGRGWGVGLQARLGPATLEVQSRSRDGGVDALSTTLPDRLGLLGEVELETDGVLARSRDFIRVAGPGHITDSRFEQFLEPAIHILTAATHRVWCQGHDFATRDGCLNNNPLSLRLGAAFALGASPTGTGTIYRALVDTAGGGTRLMESPLARSRTHVVGAARPYLDLFGHVDVMTMERVQRDSGADSLVMGNLQRPEVLELALDTIPYMLPVGRGAVAVPKRTASGHSFSIWTQSPGPVGLSTAEDPTGLSLPGTPAAVGLWGTRDQPDGGSYYDALAADEPNAELLEVSCLQLDGGTPVVQLHRMVASDGGYASRSAVPFWGLSETQVQQRCQSPVLDGGPSCSDLADVQHQSRRDAWTGLPDLSLPIVQNYLYDLTNRRAELTAFVLCGRTNGPQNCTCPTATCNATIFDWTNCSAPLPGTCVDHARGAAACALDPSCMSAAVFQSLQSGMPPQAQRLRDCVTDWCLFSAEGPGDLVPAGQSLALAVRPGEAVGFLRSRTSTCAYSLIHGRPTPFFPPDDHNQSLASTFNAATQAQRLLYNPQDVFGQPTRQLAIFEPSTQVFSRASLDRAYLSLHSDALEQVYAVPLQGSRVDIMDIQGRQTAGISVLGTPLTLIPFGRFDEERLFFATSTSLMVMKPSGEVVLDSSPAANPLFRVVNSNGLMAFGRSERRPSTALWVTPKFISQDRTEWWLGGVTVDFARGFSPLPMLNTNVQLQKADGTSPSYALPLAVYSSGTFGVLLYTGFEVNAGAAGACAQAQLAVAGTAPNGGISGDLTVLPESCGDVPVGCDSSLGFCTVLATQQNSPASRPMYVVSFRSPSRASRAASPLPPAVMVTFGEERTLPGGALAKTLVGVFQDNDSKFIGRSEVVLDQNGLSFGPLKHFRGIDVPSFLSVALSPDEDHVYLGLEDRILDAHLLEDETVSVTAVVTEAAADALVASPNGERLYFIDRERQLLGVVR